MPRHTNAKEAYDAGAKAKRQGFERVTPYYNQPRSDYWWLAGFDGVEFFEAEQKQPEFEEPAQILKPDDARAMGMPVPEDVAEVHIHNWKPQYPNT